MSVSPRSPRKMSDLSSLQGSVAKTKPKQRGDRGKQQGYPFLTQDEHSDVTIVCDGKQLYANSCLIAYSSPVLKSRLFDDQPAAGKGGSKKSVSSAKELDFSDKNYNVVVAMLTCIDPRCDEELTDKVAISLLPLAEEFEMAKIKKDCEKTLTTSFAEMRKGRRVGKVPTDVTLEYLRAADRHGMNDLLRMCIEECVYNDNPFSNKTIADADGISEKVKFQIVNRKYEKVQYTLIKERRERTIKDQETSGSKLWRK